MCICDSRDLGKVPLADSLLVDFSERVFRRLALVVHYYYHYDDGHDTLDGHQAYCRDLQ
jgi:hypothetical protein